MPEPSAAVSTRTWVAEPTALPMAQSPVRVAPAAMPVCWTQLFELSRLFTPAELQLPLRCHSTRLASVLPLISVSR